MLQVATGATDAEASPLAEEIPVEIAALLQEFEDVFLPITSKPEQSVLEHHIQTTEGAQPVRFPCFRLSETHKAAITEQVSKPLQQGLIQPSQSPWASRVLLVPKRDGSLRMCIDYRALNSVTKRDAYPLPRPDDLLHDLSDARIFSKLDLQQGYHQILVAADSIEKTAFTVPEPIQGSAHFEWCVLPFGLVNAPPFFQRIMDQCFQDFGREIRVYMDDVLVPSASLSDHVSLLRRVLRTLRQNALKAKRSKCVFAATSIQFLGHELKEGGIAVAEDKVAVLQRWRGPFVNVKQVRQFVGATSYYRSFIPGYAAMAMPLTRMTRKNAVVVWSVDAQQAVDRILHALATAPVLASHAHDRNDRITTDASAVGLGAVFEQQNPTTKCWHPCSFWSRQLNAAQRNYAPTNREWLAVVEAVTRVWRHWVQGRPFELRTDHAPLKDMLCKPSPDRTPLQMRWYLALAPYDFHLIVIRGKENAVADALSRSPMYGTHATQVSEAPLCISLRMLQIAAKVDTRYAQALREAREHGTTTQHHHQWHEEEGLLVNETQHVWVPAHDLLRAMILSEEHEPPYAGHRGAQETVTRMRRRWWWPNMKEAAEQYVLLCDRCQHNSARSTAIDVPPQTIIANTPGSIITLDFMSGLAPADPTTHTALLAITDRFTRMVWLIGCPDHLPAEKTVQLLLQHVVARYGLPQLIISDRGPQFESTLWTVLWERFGSRVALAASKHPQTDGATERTNRTVLQAMRKHLLRHKQLWERYLPLYEMAINAATNATTHRAPFEVMLGRLPEVPVAMLHHRITKPLKPTTQGQFINHLQEEMHKIWVEVRTAVLAHADKANNFEPASEADQLQPGDEVLLRWHPLPGQEGPLKQQDKWGGPFLVKEQVAPGSYRLRGLPKGTPEVWNQDRLRRYLREPKAQRLLRLSPAASRLKQAPDGSVHREVEAIVDVRPGRTRTQKEFKVLWRGVPEASWEKESALAGCQDLLNDFLAHQQKAPAQGSPV